MERTILSHNETTGEAKVRFEHAGVVIEQDFNLKDVIPGSRQILEAMNTPFTKARQLAALERLTERLTSQIDQGEIKVPADPTPPEPPVEPTATEAPDSE